MESQNALMTSEVRASPAAYSLTTTPSTTPAGQTREGSGVLLSEKERGAEKKPMCNSMRVRGGGPGASKQLDSSR